MSSLCLAIITFNCARQLVRPDTFAQNIYKSIVESEARTPDIFVLSLQEVAPIAYAFSGGSFLVPYFDRVRHTIDLVAKSLGGVSYVNLITRNVGMTAIMAFVKKDLSKQIQRIETAGVGVGVHAMGNKGAVGLRIGYAIEDTVMDLTFLAAHLAPMENNLSRRNEDWKNIVKGLVFNPVGQKAVEFASTRPQTRDDEDVPLLPESIDNGSRSKSGLYTPTSYLFLAGDLNYRTSRTKPSEADYNAYPQPTNDTTHFKHYTNLLKQDQLNEEIQAGRTCQGFLEAPILFPPTYKYSDSARTIAKPDRGEWAWAKHRWPSWCDRILYFDVPSWMKSDDSLAQIQIHKYDALPLMLTSDHRPVALVASIPRKPIPQPRIEMTDEDYRLRPPFDVDLQWREKRKIARRKEIVVGILAYLGLTWEGRGIFIATLLGALGGWAMIRSSVGD